MFVNVLQVGYLDAQQRVMIYFASYTGGIINNKKVNESGNRSAKIYQDSSYFSFNY